MDQHAFEIVSHISCSDSQSSDALFAAPGIAPLIPLWVVAEFVGEAIDLDRQCGFVAEEIKDIRI